MSDDYARQLKTAVIEGFGSALADIVFFRAENDLPDMNLTDEEQDRIVNEITHYVESRFKTEFKDPPPPVIVLGTWTGSGYDKSGRRNPITDFTPTPEGKALGWNPNFPVTGLSWIVKKKDKP